MAANGDVRLTRRQKKELADAMTEAQLDINSFHFVDVTLVDRRYGSPQFVSASKCVHTSSNYYFTFGPVHLEWSPDGYERLGQAETTSWAQNLGEAAGWLESLKAELDAPDPWETITASKSLADYLDNPTSDDAPFEQQERTIIERAVEEAKKTANNAADLEPDQLKRIADSLDSLKASTANVTKKQFLTLVLGEAMKLAFQKINMDVIMSVWNTLNHGIQAIYGLIRLLGN